MKRMQALPRVAAMLVAVSLGCSDNSQNAAGIDGARDPSFQKNCIYWPEGCPEDPPPPPGPGYHMGAATTPDFCFSSTGAGINDADYDGMDDGCEQRLAAQFSPSISAAPASFDCGPTIEPYWAVKYFPGPSNLVRIAYLLAYRRDCGTTGIGTALLAKLFTVITLNGFINNAARSFGLDFSLDDPGAGHSGDSEWVMVNVRYNTFTTRWALVSVKFSAHDGTVVSGTKEWPVGNIEIPGGSISGGFPRVWVALNKHANYVSRASCNAGRGPGGLAHDNCDPSIPDSYRLPFNYLRNVGSRQKSLINAGTCVQSVQPAFYPGTECFWNRTDTFDGWLQYPYGHPASPYYGSLLLHFECFWYDEPTTNTRRCTDFGVNRLGT